MTMEDKKNAVKLDEEKLEQVSGGSAGDMKHYGWCKGYNVYHMIMQQIELTGMEMTAHQKAQIYHECLGGRCLGEYDCSSCPVKAFIESL